ncbi:RNA polymerase sigma factor [bacterium]|nr:RNA polymerase sigma factor [bacterium]
MDEEKFKSYYQQFGHLVFKRARAIVSNDEDAQDIVQTVFFRIWKYGDKFKRKSEIFTWIYRITTNCSFDLLRQRAKHSHTVQLEDRSVPASESGIKNIEDRDLFLKMVSQLDRKAQHIVYLYYIESFTQQEIAVFLNISRKTVGKKLKKFQQKLR